MRRELIVKSKSLAGTSDLTLLASITPGLVPSLDTVTHKSRIKRLLQTLNAGRGSSQEYALLRPFADAVERVGKIHSVRVAVLEPENKVMLAVTFDGSWEAYIRVLWQKVGTLLDIIFFDTEGYVSAYDNRFEQWEAWCRRVQVETHFFYGMPNLTVDDVRYLRHEEQCHRQMPGQPGADLVAVRYAVQSPEQLSWQVAAKTSAQTSLETMKQGFESLAALYRLADLYLPSTEDGLFLQRAARDLLMEFVVLLGADEFPASLLAGARERFDKQLVWLLKTVPAPKNTQRALPPMPAALPEFDRADVQGGIVRAYDGVTHGCLLLLAIEDRDRAVAFFRRLVDEVTVDSSGQLGAAVAVNVAFTYEGLRAAGLAEAELALFPEEFREGMEARASFLGDVRGNHPRRWKLPRRFDDAGAAGRVELAAVHVVLQLRVRGQRGVETLDASDARYLTQPPFAEWLAATRSGGMRLLAVEQMQRRFRDDGAVVEHFGFADGDSDPGIDPSLAGRVYPNQIRLGEVLLGYGNEADWPSDPEKAVDPARERSRIDWLRNGSFLVVRKLAQDVAALDDALAGAAHRLEPDFPGLTAEALAEKMMGRTKHGDPLVDSASACGRNDFDYSGDAEGRRCPFHAHIRRANPRLHRPALNEAEGRRTPRIVRRGMSYGPAATDAKEADRGLVFMAYNASIGEQFEIVQRWIAGGNSSGGYSGQSDPFLGVAENGARRTFRFEHQAAGADSAQAHVVSIALDGNDEALGERRPFVRLEWGAYLFAPSMTALRRLTDRLAAARPAPEPAWSAAEGAELIAHLQASALVAPEAAADAWKAALEDPVEVEKFRSASIWAAIRERHGGVLRTPYGVLVADRTLAMQVLGDGATYSVSGYAKRLDRSIGAIYLGKDDGDEYQRQCRPVNDAIQAITRARAFADTRAIAAAVIAAVLQRASLDAPNPVEPSQWELILEIKELIDPVLGKLCQCWFGLPTTDDADIRLEGSRWDAEPRRALYPGHFTAPSRYVFQPRPGPAAEQYGCDYGSTITAAFTRFLQSNIDKGTPWPIRPAGGTAPLGDAIWTAFGGPGADLGLVARTLVGAMMGFLPTVDGNLRRGLAEWLYEGTFWSLRERWQGLVAPTLADAEAVLAPPLRRAMQLRPSPELVWRTSTHAHALAGVDVDVDVGAGDIVVVSIASAAQQCLAAGDPSDSILFGGDRSKVGHPTHACPGYEAAMGVLLGFIAALLDVRVSMRPSAVPLALTFEGQLGDFAGAAAEVLLKARAEAETEAADKAAHDNSATLAGLEAALSARAPPSVLLPARRPPQPGADLVIGLGDSWFHYFALDVFDVLREKHGYDALSLAQEGAGLLSIRKDPAQLLRLARALDDAVRANRPPKAILLSAGGNDVVTPQLAKLLAPRASQALFDAQAVEDLIDVAMKQALVETVERIDGLCRGQLGGSLPIVLHGYGTPHPDGRGPLGTGLGAWLRPDFTTAGYDRNDAGDDRRAFAAMKELIDRLNEMQREVAAASGANVVHVDLRPVLRSTPYTLDWGNELHPTADGFVRVADAIAATLKAVIAAGAAAPAPA